MSIFLLKVKKIRNPKEKKKKNSELKYCASLSVGKVKKEKHQIISETVRKCLWFHVNLYKISSGAKQFFLYFLAL